MQGHSEILSHGYIGGASGNSRKRSRLSSKGATSLWATDDCRLRPPKKMTRIGNVNTSLTEPLSFDNEPLLPSSLPSVGPRPITIEKTQSPTTVETTKLWDSRPEDKQIFESKIRKYCSSYESQNKINHKTDNNTTNETKIDHNFKINEENAIQKVAPRNLEPNECFSEKNNTSKEGRSIVLFGVRVRLNTKSFRLILYTLIICSAMTDLSFSLTASSRFLELKAPYYSTLFVRVVCVACLGLIENGCFQREDQHEEEFETVVKDRTKEIKSNNTQLQMVGMAFQASETPIVVTDLAEKIVWINTAFERMCQRPHGYLIDKNLRDVLRQLDPTRDGTDPFKSLDNSTDPSEAEIQIGDSIFSLKVMPFRVSENDKEDEMKPRDCGCPNDRILMTFNDITSFRDRELAKKEAQGQAMKAKAMGEAIVTLTHELRTPLQGIRGVTSMLLQQAGDLKPDIIDSLKLIMASSGLLLNLINNLLDIKRVDAKMMEEFPMSPIVASNSIEDAVGFCQPLASISNVKIDTDLRIAKKAIVMSNALRLQQVLTNIISNAIKYTKTGSEVHVRVRISTLGDAENDSSRALARSRAPKILGGINDSSGKTQTKTRFGSSSPVLIFSVSDRGPGISPNHAGQLFTRYTQLDTKPNKKLGANVQQPSGVGLGLKLCNFFVERMNGLIWATNNGRNKTDGTTFSFFLPLVSVEPHEQHSVAGSPDSTKGNDSVHRQSLSSVLDPRDENLKSPFDRRVLLVDDIMINRKVIHRMLKKIGVTNLVTVESGEKAIEELSSNPYDLVITDLQMPGMSGAELSRAINSRWHRGDFKGCVPVVIGLTADTSVDNIELCAASGMADLLYKPLTLPEIRHYFKTAVPSLEAGVWYSHVNKDQGSEKGPNI